MVSIEKELADLLEDVYYNAPYELDEFMETAKRIIAKYPQLLAEKVIDAETEHNNYFKVYCKPNTCIQIFIREVQ